MTSTHRLSQYLIVSYMNRITECNSIKGPMNNRQYGDFFEGVIEHIGDPILVVDLDYHVIFANKAFKETFGVTEPIKKDRCCYHLLHRLNRRCDEVFGEVSPCPGREVIFTKRPKKVTQICLDSSDNEIFMEIYACPIFSSEGKVAQVVESYRNITDHKRAQDELLRLTSDLQGALAKAGRTSGLLTICESCNKICYEKSSYRKTGDYLKRYANVSFTYSLCPECKKK